MRIISGSAKGRRLFNPPPRDRHIRPTTDRAREALFSIIGADFIRDAFVLDLFAGTGALGCEALSRGAEKVCFIDHSRIALELIRKNISLVPGGQKRSTLIRYDLKNGFAPQALLEESSFCFDLIFADPPYQTDLSEKTLIGLDNSDVLSEKVLVIIEEKKDVRLPAELNCLARKDTRTYGDTSFVFYCRKPAC
jgi:16S rRNA (guanine966-N2)-methyltransferase